MMERIFALVVDNKVVNIVVGVEEEVLEQNPHRFIEFTHNWDYTNGIDGGQFFPLPEPVVEVTE